MPLKVGLIGFGKTGSLVAQEILKDPALNLIWVCRKTISSNFKFASHALGHDENFAPFVTLNQIHKDLLNKMPVDLVIDFSTGSTADIYDKLAQNRVKIISAISKYTDLQKQKIKLASEKTAILSSPNITLGINWVLMASKVLKQIIPQADIEIVEEHFRDKKEISGTALKLAEHLGLDSAAHVNSIRVGGIVGKHEIIFGLPFQTIRLTHESISRSAFGTGAIYAAKWLCQKNPGLYKMENVFHENFLEHLSKLKF